MKTTTSEEVTIPTVKLGLGEVIIGTIETDTLTGVCFCKGGTGIGVEYPEMAGKLDSESRAYCRILSSSVDSLDILIEKLTEAKNILENKQ